MRQAGWENKLFNIVEQARHKKFKWGEHDCFTFAVQCEAAVNGDTKFPELFDAEYINAFGATKSFMRHGYRGMMDCIDRRCSKIDANMVKRGDWVALDMPEGIAIGECVGDKIAATGVDGLVFLDIKTAKAGWSI